jgi:hypothetical protein
VGQRPTPIQYGNETSVVRIHSGNGPHEEMDRRAIACFDQALEHVGLGHDERLGRVLHDYYAWATTTTMSRYRHSAEDVPRQFAHPEVVLGTDWSVKRRLTTFDGIHGASSNAQAYGYNEE